MLKGLVGSKSLTRNDMESVLDKMREHLIGMASHLHLLSDDLLLQFNLFYFPLSFFFLFVFFFAF